MPCKQTKSSSLLTELEKDCFVGNATQLGRQSRDKLCCKPSNKMFEGVEAHWLLCILQNFFQCPGKTICHIILLLALINQNCMCMYLCIVIYITSKQYHSLNNNFKITLVDMCLKISTSKSKLTFFYCCIFYGMIKMQHICYNFQQSYCSYHNSMNAAFKNNEVNNWAL